MEQPLLLSLSDVAQLARVQRPVVSTWRARSRATATPFPQASSRDGGRELFAADAVAAWLGATGRGNNPNAAGDAAAFAVDARDRVPAVTALLALRALSGRTLSGMASDDLLDLADETDPDDDFIYREIEQLGSDAAPLAGYVDRLVDAAYSPAAAFEQVMAGRFRAGLAAQADTALHPSLLALAADAALAMAGANEAEAFWESTPGGSDLALAVSAALGEVSEARLGLGTASSGANAVAEAAAGPTAPGPRADDAERLAFRRLRTHLLEHENLAPANPADTGPRILLAQFPGPSAPASTAGQVLDAIDELVLSMGEADGALVIAPARWLVDPLAGGPDATRSRILRMGRIRAAIRLPSGLVPARVRQPLAVWVLGSAHRGVPIAERWTMVADLGAELLDAASRQDLVSDVAASLGTYTDLRAHSFRFARLVPTRLLLASRASLTAAARHTTRPGPGRRTGTAEHLVLTENVLQDYERHRQQHPALGINPAPHSGTDAGNDARAGAGARLMRSTIDELLGNGSLACLPGSRLDDADLAFGSAPNLGAPARPRTTHGGTDSAGLRIIGSHDLDGAARHSGARALDAPAALPAGGAARSAGGWPGGTAGHVRIDPLVLADRYPRARLTEPGDVVFRTSPSPAALVDEAGSAVVRFPARILRIRTPGLVPAVLAADITAAGRGTWRRWSVRRFEPEAAPALAAALDRVHAARTDLMAQLGRLATLENLLADGTAAGALEITTEDITTEPEGTR